MDTKSILFANAKRLGAQRSSHHLSAAVRGIGWLEHIVLK